MFSAKVLLAFGLVAVAAGPCKPVTTSLAVSSGTTLTVDSTTLAGSTESTSVTVTETETGTATTATLDATLTSDLTTLLTATSDLTTLTTEAATTTTEEAATTEEATTTEAATTTTAEIPDSTQFNIYPNQGVSATGPLKVRIQPGGSVYFNNPSSDYTTGTFVVNSRGKLVNGNQLMCAFFRSGQQYGDIVGCPPADEADARYVPIDCELGAEGQLDCSVQGRFCYYNPEITCDARGLYPYFYIESAGSFGYGLILGSNGLNLTPVELAAQPEPTEP
ncbi:HPP family [Fusarium denticulatum]|uniref:HPP family n=1 Tax=Fusarium denticulatum TaxID=48507 RepID=A0A8H5WHH1_9HYPO|nr:HPP family [Fusarium denticulatum]